MGYSLNGGISDTGAPIPLESLNSLVENLTATPRNVVILLRSPLVLDPCLPSPDSLNPYFPSMLVWLPKGHNSF